MKALYRSAERLMAMDETSWERHANPWSVYTRFTVLPLIVLAIWSRVWLGWGAVLAVAAAIAWAWINPRLFAAPQSLDSWASRGVLGERIFLNRRDEIPRRDRCWADGLALASLPGAGLLIFGLVVLNAGYVIFGLILTILPKVWFVDRMTWIYDRWLIEANKELGDV